MKGTLPLKIQLRGCLPIRRASGTTDPKMQTKLVRMVHTLHEQGRDDLVNAIARGTLQPLQVYNLFRFNRLDDLPHAEELPLFRETWRNWLQGIECSDDHRLNTRYYFERFEKRLPETATIGAVVPLLAEFRAEMHGKARSFNLAKSNVQAFLRKLLGRRHRLYMEASDIPQLKITKRRAKHPLTPDQLRGLVKDLGDPYGPMAWTMATTGMHWKEYVGSWEPEGIGLRIHGTKVGEGEGRRDRLIPLVSLVYPPSPMSSGTFRYHLDQVTPRITPYDLRRTFTTLMVEANIPRPRRKSYMGHTADDITALYEWQEVREYLSKDAEAMRRVLGEPPGGPTLQVVRA